MLSPVNPLKSPASQLPFAFRADYICSAIEGEQRLRLVTLEAILPLPHYTVRTLQALRLLHPDTTFSLFIGSDNLALLERWYDYSRLIASTSLHVYPRPGYDVSGEELARLGGRIIFHPDAPQSTLSATELREAVLTGVDRSADTAVPERWEELCEQIAQLQTKN